MQVQGGGRSEPAGGCAESEHAQRAAGEAGWPHQGHIASLATLRDLGHSNLTHCRTLSSSQIGKIYIHSTNIYLSFRSNVMKCRH